MCGRYTLLEDDRNQNIREILDQIERKHGRDCIKTGEIFPTAAAPILVDGENGIQPDLAKWGFPHFASGSVVANAPVETAEKKWMFHNSLYTRRCLIPCTGFLKWGPATSKQRYTNPDHTPVYIAGMYNDYNQERHCVVLTAPTGDHPGKREERLPVVIPAERADEWLSDTVSAFSMLHSEPSALEKTDET